MKKKFAWVVLLALTFIIYGCSHQQDARCKPVLFPYAAYDYKADVKKLTGAYVPKKTSLQIDFHKMEIQMPRGWRCKREKGIIPVVYKFSLNDKSFILSFNRYESSKELITEKGFIDFKNLTLIGCKKFTSKGFDSHTTIRDYYADLYLMTSHQLKPEADFWQYYILWRKTQPFFNAASKIIYFKGRSLEAFQEDIDPQKRPDISRTTIDIFPKKIAPDFLSLTANFSDDAFFASFLDMLNSLNPSE
jgi:hypothetical protein